MTTKRWIGNAAATYDLWTISLSGTVTSQTYSMTINGKSVTYTSTGGDTATTVLSALVSAWNDSTIPEFTEATAGNATSSTCTITGDTAGKPLTVSVSTGGSATFTIAHTTTATGPNDFSNGQNWSGGSAPANSDTLLFDQGSVPCKYNLSTSLTGVTVVVDQGYTGTIGLPFYNNDSSTAYAEYRTTALTLAGGTLTINAPSCQRANFAFGSNTSTIRILNSGQRIDPKVPVVLITGGDSSSELDITKGDVGVAFYTGTTATFPAVNLGYQKSPGADVTLVCGTGATLTTISKNGGTLTVNSAVTTLTQRTAGGTTMIEAGAITTLDVQGGTAVYKSTGTLGTATVSNNGILDFDQDPRAKTVTNPILLYGDKARVKDNQRVVNSGTLSVTTQKTTTINVEHGAGNILTLA